MSTFNGVIHEFPDIRIDYFRGFDRQPPLACFLSHVHSDHLAGLDKLRSPFVYCSAATREILLRLEKYPCRLNYAKGIFEDPRMQTYKHLAKVLKPIPLDTPTEVELEPGRTIQVTLLDANHCSGAVMFLIEGDGKAILYTGDIRSEPWWVNSIARNPTILQYSMGIKCLDCIYLDTSIVDNFPLQSKAEGICELLEKVARYPKDTIFFMQAWTYGYEEVWVALSKALNSKIHVDTYKMGVFKSLATKLKDNRFAAQTHLTKEAPYLAGFTCGNNQREGCLTLNEDVRIHSCEKGTACAVVESKPIVWIKPIVAHLKEGRDMVEVGIGGGGDDLTHKPSLEIGDILAWCEKNSQGDQSLDKVRDSIKDILESMLLGSRDICLDMDLSDFKKEESTAKIFETLAKKAKDIQNPTKKVEDSDPSNLLPRQIVFPYARHSSLPELRHLVHTFKPKNVWPCTVDPVRWEERGHSIQGLFGDCCSGDVFKHDLLMEEQFEERRRLRAGSEDREHGSQHTTISSLGMLSSPMSSSHHPKNISMTDDKETTPTAETPRVAGQNNPSVPNALLQPPHSHISLPLPPPPSPSPSPPPTLNKRNYESFQHDYTPTPFTIAKPKPKSKPDSESDTDDDDPLHHLLLHDSQTSSLSTHAYATRLRAYRAARANMEGRGAWNRISLISTTDHHSEVEPELGNYKGS